jgi:hypothetical protein
MASCSVFAFFLHSKPVKFPESLAGRTVQNYDMYSGYVNVTEEDWLFYWFFEADQTTSDYTNPNKNNDDGRREREGGLTETL